MNKFTEVLYRIAFGFIPDRTIRGSYRFLFLRYGFKEALKIINKTKQKLKQQNTSPKYYLSIVAALKNEDLYIKEWIEYYLLMGVEHFYIYDNESTDNSRNVLEPYIQKGIVTYTYYPGEQVQSEIYNSALETYGDTSKWFAYLDLDEFVKPKTNLNLAEYLKTKEQYNQVTIQWVVFGDNNHKTHQDGLVIEKYTAREKNYCETMKSIVQPKGTFFVLIHKHSVYGKSYNAPYKEIQCNHYYCKSLEDFKNKKSARGSFDYNYTYEMKDFNKYNRNDIQEYFDKDFIDKLKANVYSD